MESRNEHISLPLLTEHGIHLDVKREDLLHPVISGNKFRKLKYNLELARERGSTTLLTFGGAYSNHILATACAGKESGFQTIGVIRGEEIIDKWQENPTLSKAQAYGMQFRFVSRDDYRRKDDPNWLEEFLGNSNDVYVIPEGGSNFPGVKGCEEILTPSDKTYDYICCAVGTGGTIAGIVNSSDPGQPVIGFPVLRTSGITKDIRRYISQTNLTLEHSYHFGGYAKATSSLIQFMNSFRENTGILLDPVYTAKLFFGIFDMIKNEKFPRESKILAIHTGGLQGITAMNEKLSKQNLTQIQL
ncbi:MAG: 1-aminocyclopropane-1-carboxylate deaminase/D-cysteine desulfhydrase [Eudoraea sp.]|nr:1-aminocyclopropane-1-carboxylate deaminase/D-cysteine desulfhydrase [Eudoraea sp.]